MADDTPLSIYPDANRHYSFTEPLHTLNAALTAARIELAAAVNDATGSTRFRPDHSAIDIFAAAVIAAVRAEHAPELERLRAQVAFDTRPTCG